MDNKGNRQTSKLDEYSKIFLFFLKRINSRQSKSGLKWTISWKKNDSHILIEIQIYNEPQFPNSEDGNRCRPTSLQILRLFGGLTRRSRRNFTQADPEYTWRSIEKIQTEERREREGEKKRRRSQQLKRGGRQWPCVPRYEGCSAVSLVAVQDVGNVPLVDKDQEHFKVSSTMEE